MKRLSLTVVVACLSLFAAPGPAFECDNVGAAATTASDDTGDASATACGPGAVAGGTYSIALGYGADSAGRSSTALGYGADSTGSNSTALGILASSAGTDTTALGLFANSAGDYSTALGAYASSAGSYGTALGAFADSAGDYSTALGRSANSAGDYSTALGARAFSDQPYTIVLGSIDGVNYADTYTDVAIGTTDPLAPLHVHRDDGTAQILVEETSSEVAPRVLFTLANSGNTKFAIEETSTGNTWAFTNSGYDFRVSLQGSGVIEFRVDNFGDAYLAGLLFENSDRNAKTNVRTEDPQAILDKVTSLPISEWAYKESPDTRHIGPMAQDFRAAFGTGSDETRLATMDVSGVAIASVQALNENVEQLEQENRTLREELVALRASLKEVAMLRRQVHHIQTRIGSLTPDALQIAGQ